MAWTCPRWLTEPVQANRWAMGSPDSEDRMA